MKWSLSGASQAESDRALANYLAPFVQTRKGETVLCETDAEGGCLSDGAGIIYSLEKVSVAMDTILHEDVEAVAKSREVQAAVDAARVKAEDDFSKKPKPTTKVVKP